jgi:hypothetical protein
MAALVLLIEDLPTYNPGDPGYVVTFTLAAVLAILVLGIALVKALRNPKMRAGRKAQ